MIYLKIETNNITTYIHTFDEGHVKGICITYDKSLNKICSIKPITLKQWILYNEKYEKYKKYRITQAEYNKFIRKIVNML